MKVIIGLGNPGKEYEFTRHNIGFLTVDYLSDELQIPFNQAKFKGVYGEGRYKNEKVILLKPLTYMNLSGESIRELIDFYKLSIDDLLIIYDDLDLSPGKLKLRYKGGSGGHNGLKSIIHHLKTEQFKRIRMGIGRPLQGDIVSHVLGRFPTEEDEQLNEVIKKAAEASLSFIGEHDFTKVMNMYNTNT
jgi:PTH1 family peptidyl-tRNA hydrolase